MALGFEMSSEDQWFVWLNWLVAVVLAVATVVFHGRWLTPDAT
jgi:hypothetical protein